MNHKCKWGRQECFVFFLPPLLLFFFLKFAEEAYGG